MLKKLVDDLTDIRSPGPTFREAKPAEPAPRGRLMTDREFWLMVRQALLMFVAAIEKRYEIKRPAVDARELPY